jgi:RHS repeat-associated protein
LYLADKNLPYSQILEERDGSGVLKAIYQFADGQLVKQVKAATPSYFHANHLSTGVLTDAAATVQAFYQYTPYGELVTRGGPGTADTIHRFAGERFNTDSGLTYLRARWMDTRLGRHASMDSWRGNKRIPISLNKYVYGNADPVNGRDPTGRFTMMNVMGGLGIAFATVQATFLSVDVGRGQRRHEYSYTNPVCAGSRRSCNMKNVFQALLLFPAPIGITGGLGRPLEQKGERLLLLGWNEVFSSHNGVDTVMNISLPRHLFQGTVERKVVPVSSGFGINSHGTGFGNLATTNELAAGFIWYVMDQQIKDLLETFP